MAQATWSTQVGIVKETAWGTAVGTPTDYLPVTNLKVDDKVTYLDDNAWRGAPVDVFNKLPGAGSSDVSWDGPVFPDTIGYLLGGLFGTDTKTGSAAPYTHKFTLNNTGQPASYTLTDAVNGSVRQASGVMFSEVGFKLDPSALFTYSAKGTGKLTTSVARPAASYSAVSASAGWRIVPKLGGVALTEVTSAELTITRALSPIPALGQQNATALFAGFMQASGKLTVVLEDDSHLTHYLNGDTMALDLSFMVGTADTQVGVDFTASKVLYSAYEKDRSKDYLEAQIDFTCLANTVDATGYGPLSVTVTNAVSATPYC